METGRPHLEELIETWELELSSQKSLKEENILELSSHLREHVDELLERNLTEEEAFAIARYQMGEVQEIGEEYGKVNIGQSTSSIIVTMFSGFFLIIGIMNGTTVLIDFILAVSPTSSIILLKKIQLALYGVAFIGLALLFKQAWKRSWMVFLNNNRDYQIIVSIIGFLFLFLPYFSNGILWHSLGPAFSAELHMLRSVFHICYLFGSIFLFALAVSKSNKEMRLPSEYV